MTVQELVELLQTMPPDFPVIYRCCSDWSVLDASEVTVQRSTDELKRGVAVHHHNRPGEYREYYSPREYPDGQLPLPADVVTFPGN